MPTKTINHQAAVIATRLVEAIAVGAIVLYGNMKVMETRNNELIADIEDISREVKVTRKEQLLRTHKVRESYEHTKDRSIHSR